MSRYLRHDGFTLTELMVGLTLSMLLALAVGNIYIQTKAAFKTQTAQTRLGEDGRYIISLFQRMAMQSGYRSWATTTNTAPLATAFPVSGTIFPVAGQTLREANNILYVRFYGDADKNIIRCDDNPSTPDADYPSVVAPNMLYAYQIYWDANDNAIKCAKSDGSNVQTQVSNVVDFKLTYSRDTDADGIADSTPAEASSMTSEADWNKVYAIRMCIVLKSTDDNVAPKTKDGADYLHPTYLDCSQVSQTATDYRLYRTFTTTIFLRNRFG